MSEYLVADEKPIWHSQEEQEQEDWLRWLDTEENKEMITDEN